MSEPLSSLSEEELVEKLRAHLRKAGVPFNEAGARKLLDAIGLSSILRERDEALRQLEEAERLWPAGISGGPGAATSPPGADGHDDREADDDHRQWQLLGVAGFVKPYVAGPELQRHERITVVPLSRLEAAEGERDRLREAVNGLQSIFAILDTQTGLTGRPPAVQVAEYERRIAQALSMIHTLQARVALSTGDRQDDDSHVRTAEATQPAQARQDSEGGAS